MLSASFLVPLFWFELSCKTVLSTGMSSAVSLYVEYGWCIFAVLNSALQGSVVLTWGFSAEMSGLASKLINAGFQLVGLSASCTWYMLGCNLSAWGSKWLQWLLYPVPIAWGHYALMTAVCLSVCPCLTLSREWNGVGSWKLGGRKPVTRVTRDPI